MKNEMKMPAVSSALTGEEEYMTEGGSGEALFLVPFIMGTAIISVIGIRALYYATTGSSKPSPVEQNTAYLAQNGSLDPATVAQAASSAAIASTREVMKNVGYGI